MTKKERKLVIDKLEWEGGFEYFITGSDFPEIKSQDFRTAVLALRNAWGDMEQLLYLTGGR